jgi:hypothetical protein
MALVAMTAFANGARRLADLARVRPSMIKMRMAILFFILLDAWYCYLVIRHSLLYPNGYHLPLALLIITVVVPLFYAWYLGLSAALDLDAYAIGVKGLLYRQSIRGLCGGVLLIIFGAILLQYSASVHPPQDRLIIGTSLLLRYILYGCLAGGFCLLGRSAKKLQQIEKV